MKTVHSDLIIRPYQANDHAVVIALLTELQNYERALDNRLNAGDDAMSEAYLVELLQQCQSPNGIIYVAECEQQVVGMISLYYEKSDDILTTVNDYLYISDLVVAEAYRKQNIATHLMKQAKDYARHLGTQYVRLNLVARNEAALNAYRKAGYEVDLLRMIKTLD